MPDFWTIFSILLAIAAIVFTYWTWKNPIDNSFKVISNLEDADDHISYLIGTKGKMWTVLRVDHKLSKTGKGMKFIADKNNNPGMIQAPRSLAEVQELNFREYE